MYKSTQIPYASQCKTLPAPNYPSNLIIHPRPPSWKLETEAGHAALVLVDRGSAVLLGVCTVAEEHAFVAGRFLLFAYAAWLIIVSD